MISLNCKLTLGQCLSQDKQTLEKCYMCHNLEITDDLVLHTVDKSRETVVGDIYPLGESTINVTPIEVIVGDTFKNREEQIKDPTKAARFNEGKPQWSYVHFKSLEPMVRVLEFGAIKYAPKNWMKPMELNKILESMQRHLAALFDGEEVDSETGISHMGHIQCNAMFYNYHKELLKLKNEGKSKI